VSDPRRLGGAAVGGKVLGGSHLEPSNAEMCEYQRAVWGALAAAGALERAT